MKPIHCPHDGAQSEVITTLHNYLTPDYYVRCTLCKATGPVAATQAVAIMKWNARWLIGAGRAFLGTDKLSPALNVK